VAAEAGDEGGPERAAPVPLATFRGHAGHGGTGCLGALLLITILLVARSADLDLVVDAGGPLLLGGCSVPALLALAYQRWRRPRVVFAELHADPAPDRLAVRLAGGRWPVSSTVVFLRELHAFRDEPGGAVRLLRGPTPRRDDLLLPPGRPADREALERCLTRSGVPRDDGAPRPPRPSPALPAPLLVVTGSPPLLSPALFFGTFGLLLSLLLVDTDPDLVPWLSFLGPMARATAGAPILVLLLLVPWFVVRETQVKLRGRVVLREDRIELHEHGLVCAWDDVVGHTSGPAGRVLRLLLRPGVLRSEAGWVPTTNQRELDAVLSLLASRQVPRVRPDSPSSGIPGARPAPLPITTLEGIHPKGKADLPAIAVPLCLIAALVAFAASQAVGRAAGLPSWGPGALVLGLLVATAGGVGLAIVLQRWLRARVGTAELFPDRVCLRRGLAPATTQFLSDVEAYDDGSSDVVWLFRAPGLLGLRQAVGVPARDEAARSRLLEALELVGVPRGVEAARRAARPADPLLVARGRARLPELVLAGVCSALALAGLAAEPPWDVVLLVLAACVGLATAFVTASLAEKRGRVTFHADRLAWRGAVVAWDDLLAFTAHEPGRLHLHLRPGLTLLPQAVPTPAPADLEAGRALLLSRGVPDVSAWIP
jgi:hypothetical protein